MTEVLALGGELFGLLEMPAGHRTGVEQGGHGAPVGVVLLNAGFIHRSGPYRMSTRLARSLCEAGYPVLRFDAPGIGDAIAPPEQPPCVLIGQVLDQMQARTGCRRFVVGGLCSAADASWKAAQNDPRIVGLILLDGIARGNALGRLVRLRRLFRRPPSRWLAAMQRRLPSSTPRAGGKRISDAELRDWPGKGEERRQLRKLLDRGTRVFALYTGGTAYFLHRWQFHATFGRASRHPGLQFEHWRHCDHTFFLPEHREQLIVRLTNWMKQAFPAMPEGHATPGAPRD